VVLEIKGGNIEGHTFYSVASALTKRSVNFQDYISIQDYFAVQL